ncbi:hypothetical protein Hanom_Chr00s002804g01704831 [Helianthus anomalus]
MGIWYQVPYRAISVLISMPTFCVFQDPYFRFITGTIPSSSLLVFNYTNFKFLGMDQIIELP